jgi:type I restriction enzyme S subunit
MGVHTAPIGSFCEIGSGTTPPRSAADRYYGGGVPWVKSGELREADIARTEETVTEAALKETSLKLVPSGTLLVAMYGATVGRTGILRIDATTNQAICHIIPDKKVADTKYLFFALNYLQPILVRQSVGGAQPNISQEIIRRTEVKLPPLAEQRRIAAILDQADDLRRNRRKALGLLEALKRSMLDVLLSNKNPDARTISLGDLVSEFRYGTSEKSSEVGHPVLRIPNVIGNTITIDDLKYVTLNVAEIDRLKLRDGDLLFVRTNGNREYVGRSAVVTAALGDTAGLQPENFVYASYLIRARLKRNSADPIFLQAYLSGPKGRKAILERAKTSAGQFNINIEGLESIPVQLPSIDQQRNFAQNTRAADQLASSHRGHLAKLDALFASLQRRAFGDEL